MSNIVQQTDDAPTPAGVWVGRYTMRKTMLMIASLIGALLALLAVAGGADAATAIEYGLIVGF